MSIYSGLNMIWCQLDLGDRVDMARGLYWLIDTPPQMVSFMTDSPQRNTTVITPAWPSVSESVLQVILRVTVFCILALPRVTLGITANEVNKTTMRFRGHFVTLQSTRDHKFPLVEKSVHLWNRR